MSTLDLARFQFGWTSVNHFFFVPVTIGLAFLTALLQTWWYRNKNPDLLRLTRFFGTLLLISVAVGVVTGLVQEFEFGMNWGAYSRLVGNVFGPPLAMEGLAAFFLESTFLGLWVFGWDKLSRRVHLACIWLVAVGSLLSAMFILAANSWMQHPVGYKMVGGKPQLDNIVAVFTNPVFLWGYGKVVLASITTGTLVMLAVSAWQLRKGKDPKIFGHSLRPRRSGPPASRARSRCSRSAAATTTTPRSRSSPSRTCCRCWPPTPGTARWSGSPRCRTSTYKSTGRGTTCRTCSSSTGGCG